LSLQGPSLTAWLSNTARAAGQLAQDYADFAPVPGLLHAAKGTSKGTNGTSPSTARPAVPRVGQRRQDALHAGRHLHAVARRGVVTLEAGLEQRRVGPASSVGPADRFAARAAARTGRPDWPARRQRREALRTSLSSTKVLAQPARPKATASTPSGGQIRRSQRGRVATIRATPPAGRAGRRVGKSSASKALSPSSLGTPVACRCS
jgi:hypothetical protein